MMMSPDKKRAPGVTGSPIPVLVMPFQLPFPRLLDRSRIFPLGFASGLSKCQQINRVVAAAVLPLVAVFIADCRGRCGEEVTAAALIAPDGNLYVADLCSRFRAAACGLGLFGLGRTGSV